MVELEFRVTRVPARSVSLLQIHEEHSAHVAALAARLFGDAGGGQSEISGPHAYAIGPTEWLLIDFSLQEMRRRLGDALGRALVRVTDVSAAFTSLRVEGCAARAVLASDIGAPWAAQGSQPRQYVRTKLAQLDVVLHCIAAEAFEVLADRSIAEYLEGWLVAQYEAQSRPSGPGIHGSIQ